MAGDMAALTGDLAAESADLFAVVSGLAEPDWRRETPPAGWTIRDQVAHLAYFDEVATRSAVDPDGSRREAAELAATGDDVAEQVVGRSRDRSGANVLAWLHAARGDYLDAFRALDPALSLPWFGPPRRCVHRMCTTGPRRPCFGRS